MEHDRSEAIKMLKGLLSSNSSGSLQIHLASKVASADSELPQDDSSSFMVSIQYSWQSDRFGIAALAALAANSFKALQFLHLLQAAEDLSFVSVIGHLATRSAKDHNAKIILGQLICSISVAIDCHLHGLYGKSQADDDSIIVQVSEELSEKNMQEDLILVYTVTLVGTATILLIGSKHTHCVQNIHLHYIVLNTRQLFFRGD